MEDLPTWLRPGVIVDGKYEMVRMIGRGGMGGVFEARHTTLGERVAIKVLLATAIRSAETTARFLREARAAFAVADEHVARVLDAGTGPSGDPYLVMELLEGSDLAEVLRTRGPLPVAEVVDYVAQACAGLSAAHAQGIVHRDVKPANLFLSRAASGAPLVKILDFGIAKADDTTGPTLTASARWPHAPRRPDAPPTAYLTASPRFPHRRLTRGLLIAHGVRPQDRGRHGGGRDRSSFAPRERRREGRTHRRDRLV
jgi:serine/threonine protein kinase